MKNPPHPGLSVRHDCLEPLGLSVTNAARALGVTRQALNNLVNGKSGISPEMAIRLDKAFGGGAEPGVPDGEAVYPRGSAWLHHNGPPPAAAVDDRGVSGPVPVREGCLPIRMALEQLVAKKRITADVMKGALAFLHGCPCQAGGALLELLDIGLHRLEPGARHAVAQGSAAPGEPAFG